MTLARDRDEARGVEDILKNGGTAFFGIQCQKSSDERVLLLTPIVRIDNHWMAWDLAKMGFQYSILVSVQTPVISFAMILVRTGLGEGDIANPLGNVARRRETRKKSPWRCRAM